MVVETTSFCFNFCEEFPWIAKIQIESSYIFKCSDFNNILFKVLNVIIAIRFESTPLELLEPKNSILIKNK